MSKDSGARKLVSPRYSGRFFDNDIKCVKKLEWTLAQPSQSSMPSSKMMLHKFWENSPRVNKSVCHHLFLFWGKVIGLLLCFGKVSEQRSSGNQIWTGPKLSPNTVTQCNMTQKRKPKYSQPNLILRSYCALIFKFNSKLQKVTCVLAYVY